MNDSAGITASIITLVIFLGGAYALGSCSCSNKAEAMGRSHIYGVTTGCMVRDKDHYVPISNVRAIDQ